MTVFLVIYLAVSLCCAWTYVFACTMAESKPKLLEIAVVLICWPVIVLAIGVVMAYPRKP